MAGVFGIVAAMPCRSMGVTGSQRMLRQEYDHRALEAWLRDGGSGEAEFAPEPKRGRARRNLRPSPGNLRGLSYPLFAIFIS